MSRTKPRKYIDYESMQHDGNIFFKQQFVTYDIVESIKTMDSFEEFEQFYNKELINGNDLLGDYLTELLYRHNYTAEFVSTKIGYSHDYVRKIAVGDRKDPRRDVLLAICTYIHATVEETQLLLRYAGQQPLYARRKRDAIIWFALLNEQDFDKLNDYLEEKGLPTLLKE